MVFLEWRKFNFFDLNKGVDNGKLSELFKDSKIVLTTSGNNHIVIGDSLGQIHLVSRKWEVSTFRAYEIKLLLAQQMRNSPLLITIGEDEIGINPLIKVWDTSRIDKNGMPYCSRLTRAIPNNRPVQASTLCVHENQQLMAVGFVDGSLLLYRGDITRDRGFKQKLIREASSGVTGLAFKSSANAILLFVVTDNSVYVYNITPKDKETMSLLDNEGCGLNCSVLAESVQESSFVVAREDAAYCFTSDGRGPCYAVEGEKVMLQWFRSYLIIVSKSTRITPTQNAPSTTQPTNSHLITVLDIQNKFIVFSSSLEEIRAIVSEWGGFYIIDCENNVYHLNEKDLQSKLSMLFKKNLYDIAIRIAKSQQYDSDGLVDIFRQYGNHLYGNGDFSGAIDQYIKTIGKLEPSYVIRKFMDSKHIEKLTCYLQAFHKQGQATEDHTTLLLNCFTKLNQTEHLKEFILQKDRELDFDVDIAIKVCRQGSPKEALMLAKKHEKHDWYIKLLIEEHKEYSEVINYIASLNFDKAEHYMKKYGNILVDKAPSESTQFLKKLCTNYTPTHYSVIPERNFSFNRSDPEDYIHLFLHNSSRLVEFLDYLIQEGCILSPRVCDTLLEHYLHVWGSLESGVEKTKYTEKVLKLLQNRDINFDKQQALVVCHMHGFSKGILYLYEEQKLYQQILRYHISKKDTAAVLDCCKKFDYQEPTLWVQALWSCVRDKENSMKDLLHDVLNVIAKKRLLSPQLVIEAIGTGQAEINLSQISTYIENEFKKEQEITANDRELTNKYRKDTEILKEKLEALKSKPVLIQGSRCAACNRTLELPSLHFLCQHSYHQHCFQSYSDNENECVACQPENKKIIDLLKAREYKKDLNEDFHSQLNKASDPFTLAAEFFRRGVFNTVKVITDKSVVKLEPKEEIKTDVIKMLPSYGSGAEARIRLEENMRSAPAMIPISEGRVRMQESRISSSATSTEPIKSLALSVDSAKSVKSIKSVKRAEVAPNPFEEEEYPEELDPFKDEEYKNSYNEEDDYNKNNNPFYSSKD